MSYLKQIFFFLFISFQAFSQTDSSALGSADTTIYTDVDTIAAFPGGNEAWKKYLAKTLNPSTPADYGVGNGLYRVLVQFVVDKEGKVSSIKALSNYGYGMEAESVRCINLSGKWLPAIRNGKPVASVRIQPIIFIIEEDGIDILSKEKYTLYASVDNELEPEVRKVKSKNIKLTISRGKIEETGEGKFIARVEEEGTVTIGLFNKNSGTLLGQILFQVYPQSRMPASKK